MTPKTSSRYTPNLDELSWIKEDGSRKKIHPHEVKGRWQRVKNMLWPFFLIAFFGLPWLEVAGRPALLVHLASRRAYIFGATFNAEDFWLVFFLLTGLGFFLFVVSSVWGRVWCGYACPHTVLLEGVFRRIERLVEGSAAQRRRLDDAPWTGQKVAKKVTKYSLFAIFALAISHTILSYFMGTDEVLDAVTSPPTEHWSAFLFVVAFSLIVYGNFAWFREQLCIAICPYGRLQGALYDRDTINVTYDYTRGEPRKGKAGDGSEGDCIDCHLCVAVCPTGIDIRNGTQLECVGCSNCIDACDAVMHKVGKPEGLIRFDSQNGIETGKHKFWRPRLALYSVLLILGLSVFTAALSWREDFEAQMLRTPGRTYVIDESAGVIRNTFLVRISNKSSEEQQFEFEVALDDDDATFVFPNTKAELAPYEERKIPLQVVQPRGDWEGPYRINVKVKRGETVREIHAEVLGPSTSTTDTPK